MLSRERVETVLERIRPMLQADGGDIELVEVHGNSARVRLTGMCSGCPSAHMTLYMGVEMALRDEIKEFEELQLVGRAQSPEPKAHETSTTVHAG
jgi:Fe-S cluster biogenesis protein NfuA